MPEAMHLKQARTASLDKGISRMCNAAGLATKLDQDGAKLPFVVGDGEFGSSRTPGPPPTLRFLFKEKGTNQFGD